MGKRIQRVFEAFVDANNLEIKPNFKGHKIMYSGLPYHASLSEEELKRTLEFRAFVDGYEGHPPRSQGPRGSLKIDHLAEADRTLGELRLSVSDIADRLGDNISITVSEVDTPPLTYERFYQMGRQYSKK